MQGEESYSSRQRLSSKDCGLSTGTVLEATVCQLQQRVDEWDGKISDDLAEIRITLETHIRHAQPKDLEPLVNMSVRLVKRGSSLDFLCGEEVLKRLASYYNTLCNQLERLSIATRHDQQPEQLEFRMLSVLSLISQLINEHPTLKFPFSKRFSQNIFMMSFQLVRVSARRKEILRILSVLLLALSKEAKSLKQFQLQPRLRASLLENYHLIEDKRTLERFNKALKNVLHGCPISLAEMKKYQILETMKAFIQPPIQSRPEASLKCRIIVPQLIRLHSN